MARKTRVDIMKNILLIMTDQQRYDTVHGLGNRKIMTPVIDSLIDEGTAFTRAYTPSPVCVPARFATLTGRYCHNTGCVENGMMPGGFRSIMEILSGNGYRTCGIGKMHFNFKDGGNMATWGFDARVTSEEINGAERDDYKNYLDENGYSHVRDPHGIRSEMYYIPQPSQLPEGLHHTSWVCDKSIEYIEGRDREKPFFLMCGIIKPHPPFEVPVPWNKLYRSPDMDMPFVPPGHEEMQTYWNRVQNRYKYKGKGRDRELERIIKAYYYGCISFIDYNLGRVFQKLRDEEIYDETMIIFTSDHGEMLGDFNCYGKRGFLDPAARVPLIVRQPGIPGGRLVNEPVSLVDIVPTILGYAGIKDDGTFDGCNLFKDEKNRPVVSQYQMDGKAMYMIVEGMYKYFYSVPDRKEWLFDLAADPFETHNRAENCLYDSTTGWMREKLCRIIKESIFSDAVYKRRFKDYPLPKDFIGEDEGLLFQDGSGSLPDIAGYTKNQGEQIGKT
ncbi:MAG: sulfatase-like hydrolase/transferase [Clostridia bacterium]|nr:sulfatase-like hydrolase/transferase [Clostridia bacterium]